VEIEQAGGELARRCLVRARVAVLAIWLAVRSARALLSIVERVTTPREPRS
jgi:hypothetical protein